MTFGVRALAVAVSSLLLVSCVRSYRSGPAGDGSEEDRDHGPPPDLVPPDSLPVPEAGCPAGLTQCGAVCANLANDAKHCGACNKSCDDKEACTIDTCVAGGCRHPNVSNGTPCDDGKKCTTGDTCDRGDCDGTFKDCSHLNSGQCVIGVCNESTGACEAANEKNGALCDDGQFCTNPDICLNGACMGGKARECSTQCKSGTCDEQADACVTTNKADGTACSDGSACTDNDACSGGACIGTPAATGASCGTTGHCCGTKCCIATYTVCCASTSTCCTTGQKCCGSSCCITGQDCCNNTTCCSIGGTCCGSACCPIGSTCCGGACCGVGSTCCSGTHCCTVGTTCCGNDCCSLIEQCCPDKTCKISCG